MSEKKSTKKMGRPKLPKGEAKGKIVPVRMSEADVVLLTELWTRSPFKSISEYIRYAALETAKKKPHRTKRVP